MIKFSGDTREDPSRPVLGIGLSRENCEKLLAGKPILFSTDGMAGLPIIEVFIVAGETEESITGELMKLGLVNFDQIRDDPKLANPHVRPADAPKKKDLKGVN